MATALDEEKKKRTALQADYLPQGLVYGASQAKPAGLGLISAQQSAPVIPDEVAGMANRPLVQSATSGVIANQPPALPAATPQAAGQRIIAMPSTTSAQEAMMVQLQNSDGVVQVAKDPNAPAPWWSRNDDVEAMRARRAAQPQFQPGQRTQTERNMPGASGELVQPGQPRVGLTAQQAPSITSRPAAPPAPKQQEGVDVGFGIRRIEGPGGTPLYTNIQPGAPMPGQPPQPLYRQPQEQQIQRIEPERQRQDVVMPRLNTRGGVFAAMADFTNQAGNALGAVAQNRANNQQTRSGREDAKMGMDANRYALDAAVTQNRLGLDRQRAGLDVLRTDDDMTTSALTREAAQMGINKAKQIEALQQQWQAAGNDPAKQKAIAQQLAVLSGKGESGNLKDNFVVIGGEQQYDATGNRISDTPKMLIDLRTMQPVNAGTGTGGQQGQQQALPPGMKKLLGTSNGRNVYEDMNGKQVIEKAPQ